MTYSTYLELSDQNLVKVSEVRRNARRQLTFVYGGRMQGHNHYLRAVIACFLLAGICLVSSPGLAQQAVPLTNKGSVSDEDFLSLQQQIKELKNPTFRAFLRMQLLSWESIAAGPTR